MPKATGSSRTTSLRQQREDRDDPKKFKRQIGVKIDTRIWRQFKGICLFMGAQPGEMLETLLKDWIDKVHHTASSSK